MCVDAHRGGAGVVVRVEARDAARLVRHAWVRVARRLQRGREVVRDEE